MLNSRLMYSGYRSNIFYRSSKMNGCVIPDTPIAVDFWKVRQCPTAKVFFLSHMHADHTCGLSSTWSLPIYCSPISKKLLIHKFQVHSSLVHALEVNASHIIPVSEYGDESMSVSLIDANHCPGAVMFLFQGYFGNILYSGDFRYTPDMFVDTPLSSAVSVDVLYLDNTYCDPGCVFPSREQAKQEIFNIIETHPCHDVVLGVHSLGKEDLMVDIATIFKTRIFVSETRYKMLEILNMPDVFSMDEKQCFVHIMMKQSVTKKNMEKWNEKKSTIAILPTALFTGLNGEPYANMDNVFIVKYSDHSSYAELQEFVARLKPKSIVPIVKEESRGPFGVSLKQRAIMSCFKCYLTDTQRQEFVIPQSVRQFMCADVNNLIHKTCKHGNKNPKIKFQRSNSRPKVTAHKGVMYDSPQKNEEETVKCNHSKMETENLTDAVTKDSRVVPGEQYVSERNPNGNHPGGGDCISGNTSSALEHLPVETQGKATSTKIMCKEIGDSDSGEIDWLVVASDSDSSCDGQDKTTEHSSSAFIQEVIQVDNDDVDIIIIDNDSTDGALDHKNASSNFSGVGITNSSEKSIGFINGKTTGKNGPTMKQNKLDFYLSEKKCQTASSHNEDQSKKKTMKRKLPLTFLSFSCQHKKLNKGNNLHDKSYKRIQKTLDLKGCVTHAKSKRTQSSGKLLDVLCTGRHASTDRNQHSVTKQAERGKSHEKDVTGESSRKLLNVLSKAMHAPMGKNQYMLTRQVQTDRSLDKDMTDSVERQKYDSEDFITEGSSSAVFDDNHSQGKNPFASLEKSQAKLKQEKEFQDILKAFLQ